MPTRVHMGRLDAITGGTDQFGLYVTGPDGTTIIDGTSNMFKIVASGGASITGCNGVGTTCLSEFTVLVNAGLSDAPAHHMHVEVGGLAYNVPFNNATVGGGATSSEIIVGYTDQSGGITTVGITWVSSNINNSGVTRFHRFYLFQEVAV